MSKKEKISIIISASIIALLVVILSLYFGVFRNGKHKSIFDMTDEQIQTNYKGKISDFELDYHKITRIVDVSKYKYLKLNIKIDYKDKILQDWYCLQSYGVFNSNKDYKIELLAIDIVDYNSKKLLGNLNFDKTRSIFTINKIIDVSNIDKIWFKPTYREIDWKKYYEVALEAYKGYSDKIEKAKKSIEVEKFGLNWLPSFTEFWRSEEPITRASFGILK